METTLQFGTGRFLRCFADLIVHESNSTGGAAGRIVAVQSTGAERARVFNAQGGRFHVAIRGLQGRRPVDRTVVVESVGRALAAADDWDEVLALARGSSVRLVISNTTEAGFALDPRDAPRDRPPRSFPAKLLGFLQARFASGGPGVTVLPCELLDANGQRLRQLVLEEARHWGLAPALSEWLQTQCAWHNTLVDRIVSAPPAGDPLADVDPLFAVAEPFALWVIEGTPVAPGLVGHPAVQCVADLAPYYLRKVRILNGAHTALVAKALPLGIQTVGEATADPRVRPWLQALLFDEIVPALEGRTADPAGFARQVLERFSNPFLEHRLADIALAHETKVQVRLTPTEREYRERFGRPPRLLGEILTRGA